MKIKIVAVGKLKESYLTQAVQDYAKRIAVFSEIAFVEISESLIRDESSSALIQKALIAEGNSILNALDSKDYVIVLDLGHPQFDSLEFASKIETIKQTHGTLAFVLGSSYGLSAEVKKRSQLFWTLSELTFPHAMVRLLLLEQLYRAFKINAHQTYHK